MYVHTFYLYIHVHLLTHQKKIREFITITNLSHSLNQHILLISDGFCILQWGHDFRPDYKKLGILKQKYPGVPMMALTATANMRVRKDIIYQLGMKNPKW